MSGGERCRGVLSGSCRTNFGQLANAFGVLSGAHAAIEVKTCSKIKPLILRRAPFHCGPEPFMHSVLGTEKYAAGYSRFAKRHPGMLKRSEMKTLSLAAVSLVVGINTLLANGGAWQTGVPGTGSASASDQNRKTDVTIEDEKLKIDLHPEYAAGDVHYRMHNTGPKVQQDFFFPVERWEKNPDADIEPTQSHIEHYKISVDGKDLKSTNVAGAKQQSSERKEKTSKGKEESSEAKEEDSEAKQEDSEAKQEDSEAMQEGSDAEGEDSETTSGSFWRQESSTIKSWKKSVIPFERNQTREVTIHYNAPYAGNAETVSDDLHSSEATFAYS